MGAAASIDRYRPTPTRWPQAETGLLATGSFWPIAGIRIRYGIATPNAFSVCVSIFPLTGSPESI